MTSRPVPAALTALLSLLATLVTPSRELPAQELQAPAEARDFQDGGTKYEPLMEFVYELESRSDLMSVQKVTETLMGRDVVLCSLSNPAVRRPSDALNTGKPIVLIVNNVHGGEVAGKDASMSLMRDLLLGELRPLLDETIVLVVPTINPDGAETRRRSNEQGFDMNRDYLKQESQEISALVTQVINKWQPHLHVDTHHGGSAPYTLVYQTCMNPAGDAELMRFGNEEVLPNVRKALRTEDYDGFWYSGPRRRDDQWQWRPTSVEPRKQHVYSVMANMVGFLFESPRGSHRIIDNGEKVVEVPREERYRHQVRGQYLGLRAMVQFAADRGEELLKVVAEAKRRATARGSVVSEDDQVVIEYEQVENFQEEFWVRDQDSEDNAGYVKVTGPVMTKWVPTKTTTRPLGYFLLPQMAKVIPLLLDHEISVKSLREPLTVQVDALYATEVAERFYYQGHYLKKVSMVTRTEEVTFPAGTFYVPMAQPRSNLIAYLLEPETDDSLATWNHLDDFIRARVARPAPPEGEEGSRGAPRGQRPGQERGQGRPPGAGAGEPGGGRGRGAPGQDPQGRGRGAPGQDPQGRGRGAPGQDPQGRGRFGGRGRRGPGQRIPIYRLMQEANVKGSFVDRFGAESRRRYVR